jgi:hypothetical protein
MSLRTKATEFSSDKNTNLRVVEYENKLFKQSHNSRVQHRFQCMTDDLLTSSSQQCLPEVRVNQCKEEVRRNSERNGDKKNK